MSSIDQVVRGIIERRANIPETRSLLVGVSGIDGCGKGYIAAQLAAHLALHSVIPAILNVDGWLNLPEKRFENFYENAIRFDQFFGELVLPLRDRRSIHLEADFVEETASCYRKHTYDYDDISVVLVEGIFLFKPQYRKYLISPSGLTVRLQRHWREPSTAPRKGFHRQTPLRLTTPSTSLPKELTWPMTNRVRTRI